MKWLLVLVILALVCRWIIKKTNLQRPRNDPQPVPSEELVACAKCGLSIPKNTATMVNGHFFCSPDHAEHDRLS